MFQIFNENLSWKPQLDKAVKPIYLAIVNALESDIQNAVLKPGDQLPPQRELADFLHVNLTTVTRAFKLCERRGLICATVGKGTFVSSDAGVSEPGQREQAANGLIEMGTLRPLYDQNKLIAESIREISQKISLSKYLEYEEPEIQSAHCKTGVLWLERFQRHAEPADIVIASGAQNALAVILLSLFQPGDKVAADQFTYTGFKSLAGLFGIRLVPIDMDENGMKLEALEKICKAETIKGLYIMPECQNPTTLMMPRSHRQEIAKIVKKNDLILIEDDPYSFLENAKIPPVSEWIPEQSIYINSTSKSLSAGLRVAFMAVAPRFRDKINRGIYSINLNTSHFNVEIVAKLIESGLADRIIKEKGCEAEARNQITDEILSGLTLNGNKRDYFRWMILPEGWTGKEFELSSKLSGVQIFCAERFAVGSESIPAAVRIATSSPRNQQELIKGLTILKDLIQTGPNATPFIV